MATTRHGDKAKSGWRHFVTPGWIITILLVIGFSYAAIMVLSPWQLHKDDAIVARNEHVDEAFKVDPTDFDNIFNADGSIKGDQEWIRRQKARKAKRKKTVDTRASKGRKLRYQVHEKLQNFMVPIPTQRGAWHDEQIDELFASLLSG